MSVRPISTVCHLQWPCFQVLYTARNVETQILGTLLYIYVTDMGFNPLSKTLKAIGPLRKAQ